jgi:hypothetical protein
MKNNLERRTDKTVKTDDLLELADLVLEINKIVFEGRQALQIDEQPLVQNWGGTMHVRLWGSGKRMWEMRQREEGGGSQRGGIGL